MKTYRVRSSALRGNIFVPPSKSHTLRAILFGLMGHGKTVVRNYLNSPDAHAMIEAIRLLGAKVHLFEDRLEIEGVSGQLKPAENVIESGNSGQVLRFIGALSALLPSYTLLTGDHSIRHQRPVLPLLKALQELGAFAVSSRLDGFAPIIIRGPMKPGTASLLGEDSQPISGLLIAASFLKGSTTIDVTNPGEKPWIDLTLSWLDRFKIKYKNENYVRYTLYGDAAYDGFDLAIPGDFSSAAFPIAAALVTKSEVTLENIDMNDCQGDKKLIDVFIQMGASIDIDSSRRTLTVKKTPALRGIKVDINDFIDAITILAVVACFAEGTTEIVNAAVARKKESDRISSIATELAKMGALIEERPAGLVIHHSPLHGAQLKSYHDHRVAMSLAVAALGAKGDSHIDDIACVAKTYPSFAKDFKAIGANIEEISV